LDGDGRSGGVFIDPAMDYGPYLGGAHKQRCRSAQRGLIAGADQAFITVQEQKIGAFPAHFNGDY
jgi:hypothetical protein